VLDLPATNNQQQTRTNIIIELSLEEINETNRKLFDRTQANE
jgi:hypothetical protein